MTCRTSPLRLAGEGITYGLYSLIEALRIGGEGDMSSSRQIPAGEVLNSAVNKKLERLDSRVTADVAIGVVDDDAPVECGFAVGGHAVGDLAEGLGRRIGDDRIAQVEQGEDEKGE